MRTLYVSDLDGTLLRSNERTSDFTNATINALTERGVLFSYATVRSLITARRATKGLTARIPLIVYNGASVRDSTTGEVLLSNTFAAATADLLLHTLIENDVWPVVYAFVDGAERFSYVPEKSSRALHDFVATRAGDPRTRVVHTASELAAGERFYFTCIDEAHKLLPLYQRFRDTQRCLYQRDIYSGEQ